MADDEDRFGRALQDLFAGEATSRIDDGARAQRLADAALGALRGAEPARDDLQAFVVASFDDEALPRPGDGALAARLAGLASGTSPRARRRGGVRRLLGTSPVVAILLISSGVLAATVVATAVVQPSWTPWRHRAQEAPRAHARTPSRPAPPAVQPAPSLAPPAVEPEPTHEPIAVAPPVRTDSVGQLFERANQLRRQGRMAAAERAYASIVARHPRANEAALARLSLADLLAAQGRHATALEQVDAYLRGHPDGVLTEEALQRKARALEALGRVNAARAAWRTLLARNPSSVYRAEAEQKLARTRP